MALSSDAFMFEALHLDAELVKRSAAMYAGFARLYQNEAGDSHESDLLMLAASCMVIAADYLTLVDVRQSVALFREAGQLYRRLGQPFAAALSICGQDKGAVRQHAADAFNPDTQAEDSPDVALEHLLAALATMPARPEERDVVRLRSVVRRSEGLAHHSTGRLGVPTHVYHSMANAMIGVAQQGRAALTGMQSSLGNYLERVDDALGAAMSDDYHWRRLRSRLLPLEPEALATCIAWDQMCRAKLDQNLALVMRPRDLNPRVMAPVVVASRLDEGQQRQRGHLGV